MLDPKALYINMVENYLNSERAFWADSTLVDAWQLRAEYQSHCLIGNQAADIVGKPPRE